MVVQEAAEMILSSAVRVFMVYVVNDGRQVVASRSGNNNFLSACIDMSLCFCFGGVESGTLQNYINTDLSPRKLCCVSSLHKF